MRFERQSSPETNPAGLSTMVIVASISISSTTSMIVITICIYIYMYICIYIYIYIYREMVAGGGPQLCRGPAQTSRRPLDR